MVDCLKRWACAVRVIYIYSIRCNFECNLLFVKIFEERKRLAKFQVVSRLWISKYRWIIINNSDDEDDKTKLKVCKDSSIKMWNSSNVSSKQWHAKFIYLILSSMVSVSILLYNYAQFKWNRKKSNFETFLLLYAPPG